MAKELPLILGGHSFIQQLGNDPPASPKEQCEIVAECLDSGVVWFDVTYQPERLALGRALHKLGRHKEARIIAWNFFHGFEAGEEVGGPVYYQPSHLHLMLKQLRTDHIDALVVHPLKDARRNESQLKLARAWQKQGAVGTLGLWGPERNVDKLYTLGNPYAFMVKPYNVTTKDSPVIFEKCRMLAWLNFACSPFVRGWELDSLVKRAMKKDKAGEKEIRQKIADHMLRYSLFQPYVDKLIVAMRKKQWIKKNIQSYWKGKLASPENRWLMGLVGR